MTPSVFQVARNRKPVTFLRRLKPSKRLRQNAGPPPKRSDSASSGLEASARFQVAVSRSADRPVQRRRLGQALGEQLFALLSPDEFETAKRTTFNAFYTSPAVIAAMRNRPSSPRRFRKRTPFSPAAGHGNLMAGPRRKMRFTGIELDPLSGRIARALHPARTSASRISAIGSCPRTASTA